MHSKHASVLPITRINAPASDVPRRHDHIYPYVVEAPLQQKMALQKQLYTPLAVFCTQQTFTIEAEAFLESTAFTSYRNTSLNFLHLLVWSHHDVTSSNLFT